ncbi:MAG TPA: ComF family protein [Steroidobacteraceae bacterium]
MQYCEAKDRCQPRLPSVVDKLRRALARSFWPASCVLCADAPGRELNLCAACERDLVLNENACSLCAEPLASAPVEGSTTLCGACLHERPPYESSFVPFRYVYPLDHLVRSLKFHGRLACGRVLGWLFAQRLLSARTEPLPQFVIPVPLAPRRYRERGYNQATELALAIRETLAISVRTDLAIRVRETKEQAGLHRKHRRRNVRGAFAITQSLPKCHVAIVDDVITTGSTVGELAAALRRAGASRIEVWGIARAQRKSR